VTLVDHAAECPDKVDTIGWENFGSFGKCSLDGMSVSSEPFGNTERFELPVHGIVSEVHGR
jgi:hypothetical protein